MDETQKNERTNIVYVVVVIGGLNTRPLLFVSDNKQNALDCQAELLNRGLNATIAIADAANHDYMSNVFMAS